MTMREFHERIGVRRGWDIHASAWEYLTWRRFMRQVLGPGRGVMFGTFRQDNYIRRTPVQTHRVWGRKPGEKPRLYEVKTERLIDAIAAVRVVGYPVAFVEVK